jgi:hypothetical protein
MSKMMLPSNFISSLSAQQRISDAFYVDFGESNVREYQYTGVVANGHFRLIVLKNSVLRQPQNS